MMSSKSKSMGVLIRAAVFCCALSLMLQAGLPAGSRLGKVTGVMGEVIRVNLGSVHGVKQGVRGRVFRFDERRKMVDVALIQVIGVSEESCLARVTEQQESLAEGQFVDIEGAEGPQTLEKVNVLKEMEENARNYFAAYRYTEPDSANCLAECRRILAHDPGNRLALELKKQMVRNYFQWAERAKNNGDFTYSLIYYSRIVRIDPEENSAYENLWEIIDLIDAESQIPIGTIPRGRPPDYYYAMAGEYYRNGQYEKSIKYYNFLLDIFLHEDAAATQGIGKNDRMLELIEKARIERADRTRQVALVEQRRQEEERKKRNRIERIRYYRSVAEDLFRKKDYPGALVYYLKLLDIVPDDSTALAHRHFISMADIILIPAGEFSRGSTSREIGEVIVDFGGGNSMLYRELLKSWVYLDSFYIDRCEVTNIQYKHFIESTGHSPPLNWKDGEYPEGEDNYPVVYVSWLDAIAFSRWT
ncbi:MAG: SUMF1/EgtB/PvdO family nonheme iron enzyme [Gemmatimonadota bacterium]|nr:SUMF1/EgtB/PvdO family nonheme iron enzyme [Gemmatimonadota bacterium]